MRPIHITDTTLRDAHQSLWATRMEIGDMLPILPKMDSVGYWSMEVWGGATFDSCLRFLDENPWERLRIIKKHCPKTPLQMLLRGQNLVGYHHYSDEIVERFVAASRRNGIDVFRVFDALNDIRNVEVAGRSVKEAGGHFEGAISYTVSPVHTLDSFIDYAQQLKEIGADTICIKDMAGMLTPFRTERMVRALKDEVGLPVHVHCHYIGGMAPMNYLKAAEAGADIIDTAVVALAFGNSQPAVEMIVAALQESPYDTGLDLDLLFEIAEYWEEVRSRKGLKRGITTLLSMEVFSHQVPGGMMSNLVSQLELQKALRPASGRARRDSASARRSGLPAARHADVPDRGYSGGHERAHGQAVEHRAQRDEGLRQGAVRQGAGAHGQGDRRARSRRRAAAGP